MNYHDYRPNDLVNGDGLRATLFVSGCSHGCKGCYNVETWNPESGKPFTKELEDQIIADLQGLDGVNRKGLSISGGDPLHPNNLEAIANLIDRVKCECSDKDIWLWSGYTKEQLEHDWSDWVVSSEASLRRSIMADVDYFIDGKFVQELHDPRLQYRGSSNQNVYKDWERII